MGFKGDQVDENVEANQTDETDNGADANATPEEKRKEETIEGVVSSLSAVEGDDGLSPIEKLIKEKYGEIGLRVYGLMDGYRTAEAIMEQTGVSQEKLVEMIDFMDEEGIIRLEYPDGKKGEKKEGNKEDGLEAADKTAGETGKNIETIETRERCHNRSEPEEQSEMLPKTDVPSEPVRIPPGDSKPGFDVMKYYIAGGGYYEEGEYERAIENYNMAILGNPTFASAFFDRGLTYYQIKNYPKSVDDYTRALKLNPDNPSAYNNRGNAHYRLQDFREAIKDYGKAISLKPDYLKAFYNRGLSHASMEEYNEAIRDFTKAIELKSDFASAYHLRGLAYSYAGNLPCAISDYTRALEFKPSLTETMRHLEEAKAKYGQERAGGSKHDQVLSPETLVSNPSITFADVAGMFAIKRFAMVHLIGPLRKPELAREYGKHFGGAILLYGPPGCGKSHIAEAMAGEAGVTLLKVSIADILNRYIGTSERNLKVVFDEARTRQPCILFFDEAEALGGRRDGMQAHWERSLVNQFLLEMDKNEKGKCRIFVIGATNAPWEIDHALRRSGRFTNALFVEPPDFEARVELFGLYCGKMKRMGEINYKKLAELTEGFSCSNIKSVCDKVGDISWAEAMDENNARIIEMNDFVGVIASERTDILEWFEILLGNSGLNSFMDSYSGLREFVRTKIKKNAENQDMFR